jgi:hypothetical protein
MQFVICVWENEIWPELLIPVNTLNFPLMHVDGAVPTILFLVWISVIVSVPVMLAWGWVRWARRKEKNGLVPQRSFPQPGARWLRYLLYQRLPQRSMGKP